MRMSLTSEEPIRVEELPDEAADRGDIAGENDATEDQIRHIAASFGGPLDQPDAKSSEGLPAFRHPAELVAEAAEGLVQRATDTKSSAGPEVQSTEGGPPGGLQLRAFGESGITDSFYTFGGQPSGHFSPSLSKEEMDKKLKAESKMLVDFDKIKTSMSNWLDACDNMTQWCRQNSEDDRDLTYFKLRQIVQSLFEAWIEAQGKGEQLLELNTEFFETRKRELNGLTKTAHKLSATCQFELLFECMGLAFHSACTTNKVDWELQSVLDTIRTGVYCYGKPRPAGEILWFQTMLAEHKKVKYNKGRPQMLDATAEKRARELLDTTLKDCCWLRDDGKKVVRPSLEETAWRIKYGWGDQDTALMKIEGKDYFTGGLDIVRELRKDSLGQDVLAVVHVLRGKHNTISMQIKRASDQVAMAYLAELKKPAAEAPKKAAS